MRFADTLLPEFGNEMRITRTLLERTPFDHTDSKPNPVSRTLTELATHIANLTALGVVIAKANQLDFATREPAPVKEYPNADALLGAFDGNVAASRAAIAAIDDSTLGDEWTLRNGHMIHHRGQLSAYLRLNNIPHPPIYGPTAEMM